MSTKEIKERVCLGAIVGVHGIRGEVKVKSWTADDADIDAYGTLENKDASKTFQLRVLGHSKELLRCKIKGVDDRNTAETLIGTELYVSRNVLPELDEDEYYQADLIGLKVIQQSSNKEIGTIAGLYNFGAGDILEIRLSETGKLEMIPFNKQYVPDIQIHHGFVVVSSALMNYAPDEGDVENEN